MSDTAEIAKTFLSHNSRDKPAVEVIQGLLERGDLQRADRPIPCWFDKDDLRSQGTWMSQLEDAVANCGAAVVFYGPDGHGPVHKYEIDLLLKRAMYEQGRDAIRLVLVLLPGAQESAIQGFISLHMWADFRKGLDDAAALQRLRAYILGEAPKSGPGDDPHAPKPKIEPYRGLEPFAGKHAIYFFGRDNEIKELCGRLQEWPFTAVIGGSGSGKSSIVRAGLQTELATQERPALARTTTITVRPGSNPIRALADQVAASLPDQPVTERLKLVEDFDQQFRTGSDKLLNVLSSLYPKDDQHLLLVIDQFEELFTHSSDNRPAEPSPSGSPRSDSPQTQFVELLAAVAKGQLDRLRIVITLRADFFDRCLSVPTLKSLIENRTLLLGKLSDDALRTVIEAPARKVDAWFEKGLVARILKDVENQNGSLPLLQHALKELWEQRRFGFLTDEAYDETGGVEGALKKRADATLQNLRPEQREIAKNIFLRLTTLGEGVCDTRRRVRNLELYPEKTDPSMIDAVLKELSSQTNRLIVTNDDGTVEVTHEALIQRWNTLKGWLAENRDDKRLHDRLRDAANEWADPQHGRDPSYLWEGGRLDLAETFDQTHPNILTALQREFLGASIVKREYAKSQKEEAEREKRMHLEALTRAEAARALLAEEKEAEARLNVAYQSRLKQVGFVVAGVAVIAAVIAGWQWTMASRANAEWEAMYAISRSEVFCAVDVSGDGYVSVEISGERAPWVPTEGIQPTPVAVGLAQMKNIYRLRTLGITKVPMNGDSVRLIADLRNLTGLGLSETGVVDADIDTMASLVGLKELSLVEPRLTGKCFASIARLRNLESLWIEGEILSVDSLGQLSVLKKLRSLSLGQTNITDNEMGSLYDMSSLRTLYLHRTKVSEAAIIELLRRNTKLSVHTPSRSWILGSEVDDKHMIQSWPRLKPNSNEIQMPSQSSEAKNSDSVRAIPPQLAPNAPAPAPPPRQSP